MVTTPVTNVGTVGLGKYNRERRDTDRHDLLDIAGHNVELLDVVAARGGKPKFIVRSHRHTRAMGGSSHLWFGDFNRSTPYVFVPLLFCNANVIFHVARLKTAAVADKANDAQADWRSQLLPDLVRFEVNEHEILAVLRNERLAVVNQQQGNWPARKCDLRPNGLKNLIGRHDNATIRLQANLALA